MTDNKLMTYKELADHLNIKVDSAKSLRRRHNWRVVPANKGREFLVEVPLSYFEELENRTADMTDDMTAADTPNVSADVSPPVSPDMLDRVAALSREIGELQARLGSAEGRAQEYDQLKAKADGLELESRVMAVKLENERHQRLKAEADLSEYKARGFLQRLFG
ncbi:hypothetical protein ACTOV4_23515 [Brucella sp. C7-11G]